MNIFLRRIFFQSNVMMNERSREVVRGEGSHLGENKNNAQVLSPNESTQNSFLKQMANENHDGKNQGVTPTVSCS